MLHRFVAGVSVGDAIEVDHKDGDPLNNRKSNLRTATHRENSCNQRKQRRTCSSVYKGVHRRKDTGKFMANIKLASGLLYLGQYDDEIEAAKAYDEAAKENFGEFARLNF